MRAHPMMMEPQWIDFPVRGDARGKLIPIEAERTVPFAIRRVYALADLSAGAPRGGHAHRALRQVIVALSGACTVRLADGTGETRVALNRPERGLVLDPMVWHEMADFTPGCVLLVLAAEHYDEADYIREWDEFLRLVRAGAAA